MTKRRRKRCCKPFYISSHSIKLPSRCWKCCVDLWSECTLKSRSAGMFIMRIGQSSEHRITRLNIGRCGIIAFILLCVFLQYIAAQKAVTQGKKPQPQSEIASPFAEAQILLGQGLLKQAKDETLEQLRVYPTSVEGYNLLGIIYAEEKDYTNAQAAFQKAVAIDPSSTKTHNNLGNT